MVCGTLARIGTEVYELARPEIGELAEAAPAGAVSSITMPHKRNPEGSEHLDTLARLARSAAAVLLEGVVAGHERDGRSWKAEWIALPEVCQLTGTAHGAGAAARSPAWRCTPRRMAANVERYGGGLTSERVLAGLSGTVGKHRAQQVLHEVLRESARTWWPASSRAGWPTRRRCARGRPARRWRPQPAWSTSVLARAHAARAAEPERWTR